MKIGDHVIFIGVTDVQVKWGSNNDPREIMKEGDVLEIENIEVHSWHTKLYFVGIKGEFNSVSFKPLPSYINPKLKNVSEVDLKKALHELHEKQELDRRQAQIDLNNAFRDGFRCGKTL